MQFFIKNLFFLEISAKKLPKKEKYFVNYGIEIFLREMAMPNNIKPFEELTLADDFMFYQVMQDDKICIGVLERLLKINIDHIERQELQKENKPFCDHEHKQSEGECDGRQCPGCLGRFQRPESQQHAPRFLCVLHRKCRDHE